MRRHLFILSILPLLVMSAPIQAADDKVSPNDIHRVAQANVSDTRTRQDAIDDAPRDIFDAIKHIRLNNDGTVWIDFGGHVRTRLENWNNFAFGAPAKDNDTFLLTRVLVNASLHMSENIRFFIEGKSAMITDRDLPGGQRAALDVDSIALEQAYVDLKLPLGDTGHTLTIRPGRQVFNFGKQRLVSRLPWANNMRRWDGISGILELENGWKIHAFWSQFVPVKKYDFNDTGNGLDFYGIYAAGALPDSPVNVDLYWLAYERKGVAAAMFNGTGGNENRHTFGGRLSGKVKDTGWDYEVEGALQVGTIGGQDINAYMLAVQIGHTFGDWAGAPRIWVGGDYASGDNSAGGDVETFNQLFPLGHAYLGYIDIVGRQNIVDLSTGVTFQPLPKASVGLAAHLLRRADSNDALYNAGGVMVRAGAAGGSKGVGTEIDLTVKYKFHKHLTGMLGYSHLFAGSFIDQSGASKDIDFLYTMLILKF